MSTVHVPFQYSVHGRMARERNASVRWVRETVAVEIPDLSRSDVPHRILVPGGEDPGRALAVIDGRIYRPTRFSESTYRSPSRPVLPETTEKVLRDRDMSDWHETKGSIRSPFYLLPHFGFAGEDPKSGVPSAKMHTKLLVAADARWSERFSDDRDERLAEAAAVAASDTVTIDGEIHTCREEPLWIGHTNATYSGTWWREIRAPLSETARMTTHLPIVAIPKGIDERWMPKGDVEAAGTRLPVDRIRLSRLLQSCVALVFPVSLPQDGFAGSGTFSRPDVHRSLDEAARGLRRVVRRIDEATAPANPDDDLSPFAVDAAEALDAWIDAMAAEGFHKGTPRHSLAARRMLDSLPKTVEALSRILPQDGSPAIDWSEGGELEGFSM